MLTHSGPALAPKMVTPCRVEYVALPLTVATARMATVAPARAGSGAQMSRA